MGGKSESREIDFPFPKSKKHADEALFCAAESLFTADKLIKSRIGIDPLL